MVGLRHAPIQIWVTDVVGAIDVIIADHGLTFSTTGILVARLRAVTLAAVVAGLVMWGVTTPSALTIVVGAVDGVVAILFVATLWLERIPLGIRRRVLSRRVGVIAAGHRKTDQ